MKPNIQGKKGTAGTTPAIALNNPKYDRNVGQVIRAASCFGVPQVWYTGNRITISGKKRLPREERMKGYGSVTLVQHDYFFEQFGKGVVPVAIEITPSSELLTDFDHPEHALYVFGPEDGSISQTYMRHCHRFVKIPTNFCTNLAAAVYIVLSDRRMKRQRAGLEPRIEAVPPEPQDWVEFEERSINASKDDKLMELLP